MQSLAIHGKRLDCNAGPVCAFVEIHQSRDATDLVNEQRKVDSHNDSKSGGELKTSITVGHTYPGLVGYPTKSYAGFPVLTAGAITANVQTGSCVDRPAK